MSMHPITFVKQHPTGTIVSFLGGMVFGPWVLGTIQGTVGVGLSLPSYGSGNGGQ